MGESKRKFWFILTSLTSLIYILWRLFFTIPTKAGIVSLVAGIALFAAELISMMEAVINLRCMSREKEIPFPELPINLYPHIDVLVATHSENEELLFKTLNGCKHMEYPNPHKVHIYLCDDANRKEMADLAKKMGVGYFGMEENEHAKAGNLNNAIEKTNSPYIVTFDADMIPRSNFLMETVPYFFLPKMILENDVWRMRTEEEIDEKFKIGFIQTPQNFYNPDIFQFNFFAEANIPNEQDYFFKEVNLGRNATNSAIYAGSNTMIAREALEEIGGIRKGNITEDFATGIDIQAHGYTCYAVDKVLAEGLAPSDFQSLIKQRQRWGRGCIQTVRSLKFWTNGLPFLSKLSYLSCLFYWWTFIRRLIYMFAPVLFSVFGVLIVKCSLWEILIIWLPSYLVYNHSLKILSGKIRNQRWSNIVDTIICPYMIFPIIVETIGIRMKRFSVTSKEHVSAKTTKLRYAIPHAILLGASAAGIYFSLKNMIIDKNFGTVAVLFWLSMNAYFLTMAILFMTGRINYRSSQRYYAKIPLEFEAGGEKRTVFTCDISEKGFAFLSDFPEYISDTEETQFTIRDRGRKAIIYGKVVHVDLAGKQWRYAVKIREREDESRCEYIQIVYDREPTLASQIGSTAVKDIAVFVKRKSESSLPANRILPRIQINREARTKEGKKVTLVDYNYRYVTVDGLDGRNTAHLELTQDIILNLEKAEGVNTKKDNLYLVTNYEDISVKSSLRRYLEEIIREDENEEKAG